MTQPALLPPRARLSFSCLTVAWLLPVAADPSSASSTPKRTPTQSRVHLRRTLQRSLFPSLIITGASTLAPLTSSSSNEPPLLWRRTEPTGRRLSLQWLRLSFSIFHPKAPWQKKLPRRSTTMAIPLKHRQAQPAESTPIFVHQAIPNH